MKNTQPVTGVVYAALPAHSARRTGEKLEALARRFDAERKSHDAEALRELAWALTQGLRCRIAVKVCS